VGGWIEGQEKRGEEEVEEGIHEFMPDSSANKIVGVPVSAKGYLKTRLRLHGGV
jgi:hypothetical protein